MSEPARLQELFHLGNVWQASDLHLKAGESPVFRVNGTLKRQSAPIVTTDELDALASYLFSQDAYERFQRDGDVTTRFQLNGRQVRLHALRACGRLHIAVRFLAETIPSLESLGLDEKVVALAGRSRGLIIFCGPTGSGKSTTQAAYVDYINRKRACHIICIEDPVEYVHGSSASIVVQREVGWDVPDFPSAIIGALRSDPDVLLIGEMRDSTTMLATIMAAETGHLVLSTLHTADATQCVERILGALNSDSEPDLRLRISQALLAVVGLRLVPRADGHGRRLAAEVLFATDAVRNAIRDARTHQLRNMMMTGRKIGMQTFEMHLSDLAARAEITLESALNVTERPNEVCQMDAG